MNRYRYLRVVPLIFLSAVNLASMPVHAQATEYQNADTVRESSNAECEVIYKTTYDFSETIPKYPDASGFSASGYEGVYDGRGHSIAVDCRIDGAVVTYSTDGKTYSRRKPVYTDAGSYTIYYRVETDGHVIDEGTVAIVIREADIDYSSSDYSSLYDGKLHGIFLSVHTRGCKVLYSEDGINYTSERPEYKEAGTYVTYFKITGDNYKTVTGSNKVVIGSHAIKYQVNDYTCVYDNGYHGLVVSVQTEGCEILYSEDGINYTSERPEYKEAGTYITYFKVMKDGYETVSGSGRVVIRAKDGKTGSSMNDESSTAQTGDDSHVLFLLAIFAASTAGLTVSYKNRKEEKDCDEK